MYFFSEKYDFLQSDIDFINKAIFGREDELKETGFCPDPALVTSVVEEEFHGRNLTVIASLTEHLYLARTHIPQDNVIFAILDDRQLGVVVFKFYWDLKFYWSNFGYGRPGGCVLSGVYATFNCIVSCNSSYVLIVGPTEAFHEIIILVPCHLY